MRYVFCLPNRNDNETKITDIRIIAEDNAFTSGVTPTRINP